MVYNDPELTSIFSRKKNISAPAHNTPHVMARWMDKAQHQPARGVCAIPTTIKKHKALQTPSHSHSASSSATATMDTTQPLSTNAFNVCITIINELGKGISKRHTGHIGYGAYLLQTLQLNIPILSGAFLTFASKSCGPSHVAN